MSAISAPSSIACMNCLVPDLAMVTRFSIDNGKAFVFPIRMNFDKEFLLVAKSLWVLKILVAHLVASIGSV